MSVTNTTQKLKERGILEVARQAGWLSHSYYGTMGEKFPVTHNGITLGYRWTCFTREDTQRAKGKYKWIEARPLSPLADWYSLEGALEAIKRNGGVCYYVNGEKSLLASLAAGIDNAICTTLAENALPHRAVDRLRQWGITRLINIYDNDEAGRLSAQKWRDALSATGIDYEARHWVSEQRGYDTNDAWIEAQFMPANFRAILERAVVVDLPVSPKPEAFKPRQALPSDTLFERIGIKLAGMNLKGAHEATQLRGDYSAKAFCCPFHDDHTPSARLHKSGGIKCFSQCDWIPPLEVAKRLNLWIEREARPSGLVVRRRTPIESESAPQALELPIVKPLDGREKRLLQDNIQAQIERLRTLSQTPHIRVEALRLMLELLRLQKQALDSATAQAYTSVMERVGQLR